MSHGTNYNSSPNNNKTTQSLPRYFTKEGRERLARLRYNYKHTPQETYSVNQMPVGMSMGNCAVCVSNTSYAYASGSAGGSPY